jgi:hypothetical protein
VSVAVTARDGNVNLYVAVNYEPTLINYTWAQQGTPAPHAGTLASLITSAPPRARRLVQR